MQYKMQDLNANYREILPSALTEGPLGVDDKPVNFTAIQLLLMRQMRIATIESGTQYPVAATIQPVIIVS